MEEFRKKVRKRSIIYSVLCCFSLIIYLVLKFLTKDTSDFSQGLAMGVWIGLEIVAVVNVTRMSAALKDEKKLKEMYIRETDERNLEIQRLTAQKSYTISTTGIAVAAIVAGFFDFRICIALCFSLLFSSLVTLIVNAYYNKKM